MRVLSFFGYKCNKNIDILNVIIYITGVERRSKQ